VQKAVQEKLSGRSPVAVYRSEEEAEVFYEVLELIKGREQLWLFHTNGIVAAQPVEFLAVPAAARNVLVQQSANSRMVRFLTYGDAEGTYYEVAYVRNDARCVCTVNEQGRILSEELPLKAVPEAVQKLIAAQTAGAYIVRIERTPGPTGLEYEVLIRRQGRESLFKVTPPVE
jgi:hypothetical protein